LRTGIAVGGDKVSVTEAISVEVGGGRVGVVQAANSKNPIAMNDRVLIFIC